VSTVIIRAETPADVQDVRRVNVAAFGQPAEADLVDALRSEAHPFVSLVAERDGRVIGHICFSPVTIDSDPGAADYIGLAPMAVDPDAQRQGVGSMLVREGLRECARLGQRLVVVLGHPAFYPRFGFAPASRMGLSCEYSVPHDTFMALLLKPPAPARGLVRYHPAFAGFGEV
jgi:putative acetyltransferase